MAESSVSAIGVEESNESSRDLDVQRKMIFKFLLRKKKICNVKIIYTHN